LRPIGDRDGDGHPAALHANDVAHRRAQGGAVMLRLLAILAVVLPLATGLILLATYLTISRATDSFVFTELDDLPEREFALVLGTTPRLRNGNPNIYFDYRMDAAARLWRSGKVQRLILSGDNLDHRYDEPKYMRNALVERGVDEQVLVLDRAGVRTFDSVIRARVTYGIEDPIIVSQEFHNRRALYIARHFGIDAVGFNARDVGPDQGLRTKTREAFARVKTLLDLWILGTRPADLAESESRVEKKKAEPKAAKTDEDTAS